MTNNLPEKQKRVLEIIIHACERGYPPTLDEIRSELGVKSDNGIRNHIKALVSKGYLKRDKGIARGIRVLERATFHKKKIS